ncbi:hypothetical protein M422DRAFT_271663 [Sphaerobolus stellatus SS14]|uniref:Ras GEF n=1 Tax=Sphaerobolus stellatus (strain SS14) TaxID=990650 RepID=A0A0C9TD72_SPHS4|nr:hypothetical protein M422DRAFT_271663 [Sphaerobolus stellatus SS14]
MPWATLEELLDKLFFVAASGDDPTFIKHFFLTYRKFATPRSVLLGMQKRIRQLSHEHSELLLGCYAQMRICDLLEEWIATYPNDFATSGAHGAITALVKQISSNPSTLHYGSDILPFLAELPRLQDLDASWSMPSDDISRYSEDDDGDEEDSSIRYSNVPSTLVTDSTIAVDFSIQDSVSSFSSFSKPPLNGTRDRKGSLPLSGKSILSTQTLSLSSDSSRSYSRGITNLQRVTGNSPKDFVKLSSNLSTFDPIQIAEQITKMQSDLFLKIEPRQWLRYAMGDVKSDPEEPISASAAFYNQLAYWVSSLIVAHERVKLREKQVERFVELARALRTMNNYVGLRAVMTGINNATFPNDEIMTMFRDSKLRLYQQYLGYGVLINSQNNHRSYRIALRHTNGPAVPDMEVHTFDIVRANDSNPNYKPDDSTKIHWGKFTLMGRMITMLQGLQEKIRSSAMYSYPERQAIRELLESEVMDPDTIQSRVYAPPDDADPIIFPLAQGPDSPHATRSEGKPRKRFPPIFGY